MKRLDPIGREESRLGERETARRSFRGRNELGHLGKRVKRRRRARDAPGESLLCEDGVAGRYLIQ